jgi:uncharacterized DUF497 family protein
MQFEWDDDKCEVNIRKHGIDFEDVKDIFNHPMMTFMDNHDNYGEARWRAIGWVETMLGVVVYTERVGDVIRIISARKATKNEVRLYEQYFKN